MSWTEMVDKAGQSLAGWLVVTIGGGFLWVIRRVFTNQKQIELLQKELSSREELRKRDREDLQEVKGDVKELRSDIRRIFENHGS